MIPTFDRCAVCDTIRPELFGKLTILGFFGICPHVLVQVKQLDKPIPLTFLISGSDGEGSHTAILSIVDQESGRTVASGPEMRFIARPGGIAHIATTLLPTFGTPGTYAIRAVVNGTECFRESFRVAQGEATPR